MLYSVYPVSKAARARKMVFIVAESYSVRIWWYRAVFSTVQYSLGVQYTAV